MTRYRILHSILQRCAILIPRNISSHLWSVTVSPLLTYKIVSSYGYVGVAGTYIILRWIIYITLGGVSYLEICLVNREQGLCMISDTRHWCPIQLSQSVSGAVDGVIAAPVAQCVWIDIRGGGNRSSVSLVSIASLVLRRDSWIVISMDVGVSAFPYLFMQFEHYLGEFLTP